MQVTQRLVDFALGDVTSDAARAMVRLSLLDWCGCALAGQGEAVACIAREVALSEAGAGQVMLVGQNGRVPMRAGAWVNGVASHALDYDDTHFGHIGHPSVAVVPAALAVAEHVGASGGAFVEAALVGAEASIRVGIWLGRAHYQAGFHQTATAGAFGATLAAGRLLGLDGGQMAQAIGLVSTRASGLKSQFGSMGKAMNAGFAAANGVEAAMLARAGLRAAPHGLEGALGFGETHAGAAEMRAFDTLGLDWEMQNVSHKFHACCHGLHAMIEAVGALVQGVEAEDIRAVSIDVNPRWQDVCNIAEPSTGLAAKFSYRHTAAMVIGGISTAALAGYSDEMANDANLRRLRGRVAVHFAADIAETAARVVLTLVDGSQRQGSHDLDRPMPVAQRQRRIIAKVAGLVGRQRCHDIWAAIEAGPDLPALLALLGPTQSVGPMSVLQ